MPEETENEKEIPVSPYLSLSTIERDPELKAKFAAIGPHLTVALLSAIRKLPELYPGNYEEIGRRTEIINQHIDVFEKLTLSAPQKNQPNPTQRQHRKLNNPNP